MPAATPTPGPTSPFEPVGEPVVAYGIVYVTTMNGYLYALSACNGLLLWRFHGDDAHAGGPPTVANGVVYFGAQNTCNSYSPSPPYLYAVSAIGGALIWRVPGLPYVGKLIVANGVIYAGSCETGVAAFRASDGKSLWTSKIYGGCPTDALASDATYLYVSTIACGGVVALRLSDGSVAWQNPNTFGGAPTVVNGTLYVGPYALRASDGTTMRTFQVSGEFIGTDAVANGAVFISSNMSLSAWNATTGAKIWQIVHQGGGYIFGVANGAIYASDGHDLNAYQTSDGALVWSALVYPVIPLFDGLPTSLGSTLYVGTLTGAVVALRAADGAMMRSTVLQ